jgi:hypothetical protein
MKIASARIASLQQELSKLAPILEMAEEDPKVYLRPLNQEFLMLGFMGFELINDGQRVNPAQGVAVQTIPCIPSVHFELVDHLRANESKRILPTTDGYISPSHDILSALNESWRNAWERQELNEVMELDAEFPFEIKIAYHDFRPRKFETTVNLRYCPVEQPGRQSAPASAENISF